MRLLSRLRSRFSPASLLVGLVIGGASLLATLTNPTPLRLEFDYPTNAMSTNLVFVLHGVSNVGTPLAIWQVDAVLPAVNWYSNGICVAPVQGTNYVLKFTNNFALAQRFLYIAPSNSWGELTESPSNVLALDPPPVSTGTVKVELAR